MSAYTPFTPNKSEQRLPLPCYRGCWHGISRGLFQGSRHPTGIPSDGYSSPRKELYNLTAFFIHAASLRQAFAHCGRFLAAASRRSLGRVSVPVWPFTLSGRLSIVALVELLPHQLANGPQAHPQAEQLLLLSSGFTPENLMRYYPMFPWAIPNCRADHLRVTHPFATLKWCKHHSTVRLACLKRAASVRSEPGSNSP